MRINQETLKNLLKTAEKSDFFLVASHCLDFLKKGKESQKNTDFYDCLVREIFQKIAPSKKELFAYLENNNKRQIAIRTLRFLEKKSASSYVGIQTKKLKSVFILHLDKLNIKQIRRFISETVTSDEHIINLKMRTYTVGNDFLFEVIKTEKISNKTFRTIRIAGVLNAKNTRILQEKLIPLIQEEIKFIIIIFDEIIRIDSESLAIFVDLIEKFHKENGAIELVGVSKELKPLFDMLGLNSFFMIHESRTSAIMMHESRTGTTKRKSARGEKSKLPKKQKQEKPFFYRTKKLKFSRTDTDIDNENLVKETEKIEDERIFSDVSIPVLKKSVKDKKQQEFKIPIFENWLHEEAGRPGAIERLCAQSIFLLKMMQKMVGVHFLILINAVDAIVSFVTTYIDSIFQAWKTYRTIQRRLQRKDPKILRQNVEKDFSVCAFQLSRLLSFPGFEISKTNRKVENVIKESTFPLKLVIDLRSNLDEMKRDLSVINIKQTKNTVKKSIKDFFKSFIPNPFEILQPIKDFFILAFIMKYSRSEIEIMYLDFLFSYSNLLKIITENPYSLELETYELEMKKRLSYNHFDHQRNQIDISIEKCRYKVQRLLQILTNPNQFIYAHKWPIEEIVNQIREMEKAGQHDSFYHLEFEKWLTEEIKTQLKREHFSLSYREKRLLLQEKKVWQKRLRLEKQLQFI